MKTNTIAVAIACAVSFVRPACAQIYDTNNDVVQTFAGYGIPGYVDGQGQLTAFSSPAQIVSDTASNLYVWDSGNDRIRKITPDGTVSTFAGGGTYFEGYGTNVSLAWGSGGTLAIDHANTLWLVLASSSYGGNAYLLTIGTNGCVAIQNGGLTNLGPFSGICFDSADNLYYSGGNRIYRYNPASRTVQAFAGDGDAGNFDGPGTQFSAFNNPASLACDPADNIYVWDAGNGTVRRIDQNQNVTTIAGNANGYSMTDGTGTNAAFYRGTSSGGVAAMFSDHAGNIYFVCGSCIRKMDAQTNIVTLARVFYQYSSTFADGPGAQARFYEACGGCFSQGMVFVADTGNNRIRNIVFNPQPQTVSPANLQLRTYPGLQITGTVGRTYQIQASPDMAAWNTVTTLLLTSSPYLWVDSNPVGGNQFYRAVMLP
jgi:WD40 repeat protein